MCINNTHLSEFLPGSEGGVERIDVEVGLVTAGAVFVSFESLERGVPPGGKEEGSKERKEGRSQGEEDQTVQGAEGVVAGQGWGGGLAINEWQVWEADGVGAGHGRAWCGAVQDQQTSGVAGAAGAVGGAGAEEEENKDGSVASNGQASADGGGEVGSKAGEAGASKGRQDVRDLLEVASEKPYIYTDFM